MFVCLLNLSSDATTRWSNIWISDPWYNAAVGQIRNLKFGHNETPNYNSFGISQNLKLYLKAHWARCPSNYALVGLHRVWCNAVSCIDKGACRSPATGLGFVDCYTKSVYHAFDKKGGHVCKQPYFLTGIWKWV